MREDSAPAVWGRALPASKLHDERGGCRESRFRSVCSCSSFPMPELRRSRCLRDRVGGTESGRGRYSLLYFELPLRVGRESIGTPCQEALGGYLAMIQICASVFSSGLTRRLKCGGAINELAAAIDPAPPHESLGRMILLGSI